MSKNLTQDLRVDVPAGEAGDWKVSRFTVDKKQADFHNLCEAIHGGRRVIDPGEYTSLTFRSGIVMSDTPSEISDLLSAIYHAQGHVLIAGLGLGVVVQGCLMDGVEHYGKTVERVTVVEKSDDVIRLVAEHYREKFGERLEIVHDDIFTWKPPKGAVYGACWLDIWSGICTDNLKEMTKLKRRFSRRSEWIGCWSERECRYRNRQEKRRGW